mmetsp:Transcript_15184/g.31856  ORF Transcript_15184/g.31856 Transcript_15184/m.31856 type:complete len:247 (-) Transcript_15184:1627-2367(-)
MSTGTPTLEPPLPSEEAHPPESMPNGGDHQIMLPWTKNQGSNAVNRGRAKKVYAVSVRWEREQEERHRQSSDSSRLVAENKPIFTYSLEDFHRYFCCCARRVGSMFFLLETRDGSPIVVAGPCWPFCTFVTVPLVVVLSSLVGYFIVLNSNSGLPSWFAAIYFPILVFVLLALFCVSCRDPGLMERCTDEEVAENGWFWNEQVGSYRPPGAMYCRECKVSFCFCVVSLYFCYKDFSLEQILYYSDS